MYQHSTAIYNLY